MICDECETVAHCMKNGCVPKTNVQQEPVAWMQDSIELYVQDRPSEYYTIPLYTTPQPTQRQARSADTWQGLTDEEIEQGQKESWVSEQAWQSAVWWAVEKLKAKNSP